MEIRWLTNEEIESLVNPTLRMQGWAEVNINEIQPTCRVLGAFVRDLCASDEFKYSICKRCGVTFAKGAECPKGSSELLETFTLQMYPLLGPMIRHNNEVRDSGETSRKLAEAMKQFLDDSNARGYLVVANSPITQRLCKRYGMEKIEVPVYSMTQQRSEAIERWKDGERS